MAIPDKQLVSFAGRPDGSILFIDWRQPAGHNHKVIRQPGDWTIITHSVGDIDADPKVWQDALKVSGCANLAVVAGVVRGGSEDVLDVMRSRNCDIAINDAYPRGRFVSTQKGASDGITLTIARQHGHGSEVDHDYGNNAPGHNGTTKNCRLSVGSVSDNKPVVVRGLRSDVPMVSGAPHRFTFPKPGSWLHGIVVWFLNKFQ